MAEVGNLFCRQVDVGIVKGRASHFVDILCYFGIDHKYSIELTVRCQFVAKNLAPTHSIDSGVSQSFSSLHTQSVCHTHLAPSVPKGW